MPGRNDPRRCADRKGRPGAGDRQPHAVGGDLEGGAADQELERRGTLGIADERVAEPQRHRVERARHRDALRLIPDPTKILHRRVQTGLQYPQSGVHAASGLLSIT